jgi:hypothetical protein
MKEVFAQGTLGVGGLQVRGAKVGALQEHCCCPIVVFALVLSHEVGV